MAYSVPRELWLYDDRCMMNWMGWLLSDHSAYMEEQAHEAVQPALSAMTQAALDDCLQTAWRKRQVVAVQQDAFWGEQYLPEIVGVVVGCQSGQVLLQVQDGELQTLNLDDLRHVRVVDAKHWWAA